MFVCVYEKERERRVARWCWWFSLNVVDTLPGRRNRLQLGQIRAREGACRQQDIARKIYFCFNNTSCLSPVKIPAEEEEEEEAAGAAAAAAVRFLRYAFDSALRS